MTIDLKQHAKSLLGIDLSGPSNHADTCMAWRNERGVIEVDCGCSDANILHWVKQASHHAVVFIDAPLFYQDGGGYRACDGALRRYLNDRGLQRLGVMAPTLTKMVYLTLRGISLAHQLRALGATVIETHPGASLCLSGMSPETVFALKSSPLAIQAVQSHWQQLGINFSKELTSDHQVIAVQALLTAEKWVSGNCFWQCDQWVV